MLSILSSSQSAKRYTLLFLAAVTATVLFSTSQASAVEPITNSTYVPAAYQYKWGDEFGGSSVDTYKWEKWNWGQGTSTGDAEHIYQQDGILNFVTTKEADGSVLRPMSLTTKQQRPGVTFASTLFSMKYGYSEVRVKASFEDGSWPAWWMQTNSNVADNQAIAQSGYYVEVDAMEACGSSQGCGFEGKQKSTIHQWGGGPHQSIAPTNQVVTTISKDDWVTYGFLWTPEKYDFYVNGVLTGTYNISPTNTSLSAARLVGFHDPLYMIINGGARPTDSVVDTTKLPFTTQFDYIRVYQKQGEGTIYTMPTITTESIPDSITGVPYSADIQHTGGEPSVTYSVTSGVLPVGLTIDAATGVISGTTTQVGTFPITVQAFNDRLNNTETLVTKTYTLNVKSAGITFDTNGAGTTISPISGDTGGSIRIPDTVPVKNGFQFAGWNTASDGSGTMYKPGSSYTLAAGNNMLYAQWTKPLIPGIPNTGVGIIVRNVGIVLGLGVLSVATILLYAKARRSYKR